MDSLARPGGNATGFSIVAPELGTKRLELLKEIVPNLSSIAVLPNAKNPQSKLEMKEMQTAAQAMGLQLYPAEISTVSGENEPSISRASISCQPSIFIQDLSKRAV
jgi:putative ABC transport system substrate-binding protein